ncbi:hypothetical protein [Nonomuraea dietziae]|uniref:hypothetical protein n=1 Tax=Nonomuraea dietziae TaxID=65515 RepID=UPI0033D85FF3
MLGDLLGQHQGQITGRRVLPFEEGGTPAVEVTYEAKGRLFDADITETGTYVAMPRPGGTLAGEGQGVLLTADGDMVTWKGQGVGRFVEGGRTVWRGAIFYRTDSQRLVQVNGAIGLFEYEVDDSGKTSAQVWEWK